MNRKQLCNCPHSDCLQGDPGSQRHHFSLPHWILTCLFLSKDPHLLWIVAPLRKTVKAVGLGDRRIRTVPGYLWLRGPTWLQAGRDCHQWYRKDICPGDIVVEPHHCHLQLAFYSSQSCCCKWRLAETIFANESWDNNGLESKMEGVQLVMNKKTLSSLLVTLIFSVKRSLRENLPIRLLLECPKS